MFSGQDHAGGVTATWLGQAGVLLTAGGWRGIVDPFIAPFDGRTVPPPDPSALDLGDVTAVLVTHEHDDHFHPASLALIRSFSPDAVVVVPAPLAGSAASLLGGPVMAARTYEPLKLGNAEIIPLPSYHAVNTPDPVDDGSALGSPGRFLGYVIRLGNLTLYHSGDTVLVPDHASLLRRYQVDVAFLPINGRDAAREAQNIVGNLTAAEAVQLCLDAGIGTLIPIHWDMFAFNLGDPDEARQASAGSPLRVLELPRFVPVTLPGAEDK
jgi:L-ascorbate metabolism protein UlaG (beta-lactamase superfamily)